jgi:hypothetical protein
MEVTKFFDEINRMCNYYQVCMDCPLYENESENKNFGCIDIDLVDNRSAITAIIAIVEDWSEKHKYVTNIDFVDSVIKKWQSVREDYCSENCGLTIEESKLHTLPCLSRKKHCNWWSEEYERPVDEVKENRIDKFNQVFNWDAENYCFKRCGADKEDIRPVPCSDCEWWNENDK